MERPPRQRLERPTSLYLLLAAPIVMLLGLHSLLDVSRPERMALGLSCLFLFLGIALLRAVMDLLELLRSHLRETPLNYAETLGEKAFVEALSQRKSALDASPAPLLDS